MKHRRLLLALSAVLLPAAAHTQQPHPHGHGQHGSSSSSSSAIAHRGHSAALHAELEAVRAATERYQDIEVAKREGWKRFGRDEGALMGEHWYHPDRVREPFDPARPSTLQYAVIGGRRVLVGVAYTTYHRPGEPVPEGFTGDEDGWHTHDVVRIGHALTEGRPVLRWLANRYAESRWSPAREGRRHLSMVHAWVWLDNPDGVFALHHRALPYLRAGLPAAWAGGADEAAAQGIALLAPDACRREMARVDVLARMEREQKRQVRAACDRGAAEVRREFEASRGAASLNRAASAAWRGYDATLQRVLRPEQKERLASVLEHGMGGGHAH